MKINEGGRKADQEEVKRNEGGGGEGLKRAEEKRNSGSLR